MVRGCVCVRACVCGWVCVGVGVLSDWELCGWGREGRAAGVRSEPHGTSVGFSFFEGDRWDAAGGGGGRRTKGRRGTGRGRGRGDGRGKGRENPGLD